MVNTDSEKMKMIREVERSYKVVFMITSIVILVVRLSR